MNENITIKDLLETKSQETEMIGMLKALIVATQTKQSAPKMAGTMAALGSVLVFMAVGSLGRETGLKTVSDIINRAIEALPSDEDIKKMVEEKSNEH